jgi:hypothetical protein
MRLSIIIVLVSLIVSACGVKGSPLPPLDEDVATSDVASTPVKNKK